MAWGDISSNDAITFTEAQGGGFSLNSGQSHGSGNECMTKDDAFTKYNLDAASASAYSGNELLPKSAWVSGAVSGTGTIYISNVSNDFGDKILGVYIQGVQLPASFPLQNGESVAATYSNSDNAAYIEVLIATTGVNALTVFVAGNTPPVVCEVTSFEYSRTADLSSNPNITVTLSSQGSICV